MLGAMVVDWLSRDVALGLRATVRDLDLIKRGSDLLPSVDWVEFQGEDSDVESLRSVIAGHEWVVNAIGITKPYIRDDTTAEVERAVRVNSLFPHLLARAAVMEGARVIQIATDCVYSGAQGSYVESSIHDADDVYGKSKSLGEAHSDSMHMIRCSIVGPEPGRLTFLLEWLVQLPKGEHVNGYTDHEWNGVTTLHFARVCHGIITGTAGLTPGIQHLIPGGRVTKNELLRCFARVFDRTDIQIAATESPSSTDRTLATEHEEDNRALWRAAGYPVPPTIPDMVTELADFDFRLASLR